MFKSLHYLLSRSVFELRYWVSLLALCALFIGQSGQAQLGTREVIKVNLGGRTFVTADGKAAVLPFDEPFHISGEAGKSIRKVELRYRIKPGTTIKETYWFNSTQLDAEGFIEAPISWSRTSNADGVETEFLLTDVGPLHPNVTYEFQFSVFTEASLAEDKVEKVAEALYERSWSIMNNEVVRIAESLQLETDSSVKGNLIVDIKAKADDGKDRANDAFYELLLSELAKAQGLVRVERLVSASDVSKPSPLEVDNSEIEGILEEVKQDLLKLTTKFQFLPTYLIDLKDYTSIEQLELAALNNALKKVSANTEVPTDQTKAIWASAIDPLNEGFKSITHTHMNAFLVESWDVSRNLERIINGEAKFNLNAGVLTIARYNQSGKLPVDISSIKLLHSYFKRIADMTLKNGAGTKALVGGFDQYFDTTLGPTFEVLISQLKEIADYSTDAVKEKLKVKYQELIKDYLTTTLISTTYLASGTSVVLSESEKSNYVSLDFGLLMTPLPSLFAYQGVNFYLSPVNKRTSLEAYDGNGFNKRFSIHLGLTQQLIESENESYENLIDGVGSLALGVGYRIARNVKVNATAFAFNQTDPNPLVSDQSLKISWGLSMSWDLDIGKAFGNVGKSLFGID